MSKPQSDGRKNLKRPRGLLASRKNADQGPSAKKPRPDDSQVDLDPDALNAQDWSDLKELYENALDAFYGETPTSALPLVRGVLHECARLVTVHKDPSIIYSPMERADSPTLSDPASAFYTIYASAWYLMYQFARTDASALTEDEPDEPVAYLLSALAACEEGQKALDVRKQERAWDLELIWGRALMGTAQAQIDLSQDEEYEPSSQSVSKIVELAGPNIPSILQRGTEHLWYSTSHYPKEAKQPLDEGEANAQIERFARALLDAAQAILAIAEYLDQESKTEESDNSRLDETNFAFAEKLFSRVASMTDLSEDVRAQGEFGEAQVLLSMGAAIAEGLEGGDEEDEREEGLRNNALEHLKSAVKKFDSVRQLGQKSRMNEEDIKPLFLEALVTLATLLPEGDEQDAMYARYREEGGVLDEEIEDEDEDSED